jgi:hypothetical protein
MLRVDVATVLRSYNLPAHQMLMNLVGLLNMLAWASMYLFS